MGADQTTFGLGEQFALPGGAGERVGRRGIPMGAACHRQQQIWTQLEDTDLDRITPVCSRSQWEPPSPPPAPTSQRPLPGQS